MTSRTLLNASDRTNFFKLVESMKLPCTVTVERGKKRSIEQNRLQRLWMAEIAEQLGEDTAEGYRAYCKLHFAVPILRIASDEFCGAYDKYIRPLPYETKLAYMAVPLDFPCTRLMTVKQKKEYLDAIWDEFANKRGVKLTEPQAA